jgi:capsular polysaccharide biosynthesis protein
MRKRKIKKLGFDNEFEKQVYDTLLKEFSADKAKVLHSCYLIWPNGKTSQADLVMVTRRGVVVVECKDFKGSVSGSDSDGDFK